MNAGLCRHDEVQAHGEAMSTPGGLTLLQIRFLEDGRIPFSPGPGMGFGHRFAYAAAWSISDRNAL